jgi:hypothetical protein
LADPSKSTKRWKFFRAGTVDQVVLNDASDLENLESLDKKLWVALACPTRGLEFEERTLDLIDTDRDGRIRPPEIIAAIAWSREVFRNLDALFAGKDSLPLSEIRIETAAGKEVHETARRILAERGREGATAIELEDVTTTSKAFAERKLNGDGVVTVDSTDDSDVKAAIADAIGIGGPVVDKSGKPGIDQAKLDAVYARVRAHAAWLEQEGASHSLGEQTPAAAVAVASVKEKVDDYFVRCHLAAFDGRISTALNGSEERIAAFAGRVLAPEDGDVGSLPLAHVEAGRPLPLMAINPAWTKRMTTFDEAAVVPILGNTRSSLSEQDWTAIKARVAAYEAWRAAGPTDDGVEKLGRERVLALANGSSYQAVSALISADSALSTESSQMEAVEKAVRLRRDLVSLLRNFVNFSEFYGKRRSAFQVGVLYVDGRCCELCLPVSDVGKHATLASLSNAYLVYCDCSRKKDAEKRTIVAAVTAGDIDNLMAGRNGVFYDRKGDDWDATITKVVDNPISIRQAFWAPYKRFVRLVQEQVSKRAAAADAEANKSLGEQATALAAVGDGKKPEVTPQEPKKIDVGTVAAIGVAVGGIATFFSSVLATFLGLGMWMPVGLLALLIAVSGPSMLIAWLKLRHRNIGPLLDANGWAVNAFARVNVPFGEALTTVAVLPRGATRLLNDPFAEKRRPWGLYLLLLVLAAIAAYWLLGRADEYLPDPVKSSTVLHRLQEGVTGK